MSDIVKRLRSTQNPGLAVRQQAADALERLTAENAALRAALKTANSQAEEFERKWYLLGDELDALRAAAGKVTCWRCEGYGELKSPYEEGAGMDDSDPCPDCTDLRRLLGES